MRRAARPLVALARKPHDRSLTNSRPRLHPFVAVTAAESNLQGHVRKLMPKPRLSFGRVLCSWAVAGFYAWIGRFCFSGPDGTGTPEDYFTFARDVAGLDAVALTDHDHWGAGRPLDGDPAPWALIRETVARFHEPGRFVTLPGYEWTSILHGHRHVLYFEGDLASDQGEKLVAALRSEMKELGFKRVEGKGPRGDWWTNV